MWQVLNLTSGKTTWFDLQCTGPDLQVYYLLWSEEAKKILLIELMVPLEEDFEQVFKRAANARISCTTAEGKGGRHGSSQLRCALEDAQSVWRMLTPVEVTGRERKMAVRRIGEAPERASYWSTREKVSWKPGGWWAMIWPPILRVLWFWVEIPNDHWIPPDGINSSWPRLHSLTMNDGEASLGVIVNTNVENKS